MKFTIDRAKWRCGGDDNRTARGEGATLLRNPQGFECCLGQVACQLGCTPESILHVGEPMGMLELDMPRGSPRSAREGVEKLRPILLNKDNCDTKLASLAMTLNDDGTIGNGVLMTDEYRETHLRELFQEHGHEIEFINDYVTGEPSAAGQSEIQRGEASLRLAGATKG
jgi:hypothetical protein